MPGPRRTSLLLAVTAAALLTGCQESPPPEAAADFADADVVLVGDNQLQWDRTSVEVPAGEVVFGITSAGSVNHNLLIEGQLQGRPIVEAAGNSNAAGRVTLEPGTYEFWCSIPGHRAAGMEGTLTVVEADG